MSPPSRCLAWSYQLVFSVFSALLIVTEEGVRENSFLFDGPRSPIISACRVLADSFQWRQFSPYVYRDRVVLWWSMWVLLCAAILGCLLLSERMESMKKTSLFLVGFVSVGGFPMLWLRFGHMTGSVGNAGWFYSETIAFVAWALLYLYCKWPGSVVRNSLILGMHFGLWCWISWEVSTIGNASIYLLLGLSSSLLWSYHVRWSERGSIGSTGPARHGRER